MFTVIDISTKETLFISAPMRSKPSITLMNGYRRVGLKRGRAHNDKC